MKLDTIKYSITLVANELLKLFTKLYISHFKAKHCELSATPKCHQNCFYTSIGCCRWTRAMHRQMHIVLHTKVNAQCDKLAKLVSRTSIVAGTVNLVA